MIYQWALNTKSFLTSAGITNLELKSFENVPHTVTPEILTQSLSFIREVLPNDPKYVIPMKEPKEMSIKELKNAIKNAGLLSKTLGFVEKSEYVRLLQDYLENK